MGRRPGEGGVTPKKPCPRCGVGCHGAQRTCASCGHQFPLGPRASAKLQKTTRKDAAPRKRQQASAAKTSSRPASARPSATGGASAAQVVNNPNPFAWTDAEDAILRKLLDAHGPGEWEKKAEAFKLRSGSGVAKRAKKLLAAPAATSGRSSSSSSKSAAAKRARSKEVQFDHAVSEAAGQHGQGNQQQEAGEEASSPDTVLMKLLALPPPDAISTPDQLLARSASGQATGKGKKRKQPQSNGTAGAQAVRPQIQLARRAKARAPPPVPGLHLCPVKMPPPPAENSAADHAYMYPPLVAAAASIGHAGITQAFCATGTIGGPSTA